MVTKTTAEGPMAFNPHEREAWNAGSSRSGYPVWASIASGCRRRVRKSISSGSRSTRISPTLISKPLLLPIIGQRRPRGAVGNV